MDAGLQAGDRVTLDFLVGVVTAVHRLVPHGPPKPTL